MHLLPLRRSGRPVLAFALLAAVLAGCSGPSSGVASGAGAAVLPAVTAASIVPPGKIDHVVVVIQENRSFDELFQGFPGADTVPYGYGHDGAKHVLTPRDLNAGPDVLHKRISFLVDYDNGKNDGFDRQIESIKTAPGCPNPMNRPACWTFWSDYHALLPYTYVPRAQIQPYWDMATQYAIGDRTFASNNGPSYGAHQILISGQENHVAEIPSGYPWGCDAAKSEYTFTLAYGQTKPPTNLLGWTLPAAMGVENVGPYPCFSYPTMAGVLDAAKITWAYYAPVIHTPGDIWSAFDAIAPVRYGPDWARNVKSPETTILSDIRNGTLPQVAWVAPSAANSDHSGACGMHGPDWVANIVNTIGTSQYWKNTVVVVLWDEWGGYYDHVPPPQYPDAQTGAYEGLGFRVPAIVISPYAKAHYVSHKQHEVASALRLIEAVFGLPTMHGADARADAFDDMFDFSQHPRAFSPIKTNLRADDLLREKPSYQVPDDD